MSTKIYDGRRFPKTKLGDFIRTIRPAQFKLVVDFARDLAASITPDMIKANGLDSRFEKIAQDVTGKSLSWQSRAFAISEIMKRLARPNVLIDRLSGADQLEWSSFDAQCGWNIWLPERGRWALTSPWGPHWTHEKLTLPSYVEEYGYWNNTDMPDGMSRRVWVGRGRIWHGVIDNDAFDDKVSLITFDPKDSHYIVNLQMAIMKLGPPSVLDRLAKAD